MLRIAIVEDDPEDQNRLQQMLQQFADTCQEKCAVTVFGGGAEFLGNYRPEYDLVLMDVEMPGMNGLDTARELRTMDASVILIFITNMAQYAIRGYEVDALDYVLKPVNYYSFELKMKKVRRILNEREGSSLVLFVKGEMRRIPVKSILYVEIRDHNLCYHTDDGDFSLTGSMKKLEEQLAPHSFARCNNCYLVNLMHVRTVTPEQVFVENTPLKISRPRRKAFMEALSAYYGGGGR